MKRHLRKIVTAVCIGLTLSITETSTMPIMNVVAEAATKKKVVKVTSKTKIKDGIESRVTLYGKADDGSVVWKYTSKYRPLAELESNEHYVNGNLVYLFSDRLYAISKSTGKVKWTNNCQLGGTCAAFDKKGNMYCTGFYDHSLYCISPKGKMIFKTEFPDRYYWPYEIKLSGTKIRVYVDGDDKQEMSYDKKHYLTYDKKGNYCGFDK